jgi:predicted dehydrogenase
VKILVAGYGSIGRVHAANAARWADVAVFDNAGEATAAAENDGMANVFGDLAAALDWGADGVVVATPHDTHLEIAGAAIRAGMKVLVEKPISHNFDGVNDLVSAAGEGGLYVVTNLRFHPAVAAISANLKNIGRPLFARAHYGHFLPSMRPGADYHTLYAARRSAGGGVIRDAIHEIDLMMCWLGPVEAVTCTADKLSDLDIDVEDYAAIQIRHRSGVQSEIHLDYLRPRKARGCELVGTVASLIWESDGKNPERCRVVENAGNDTNPEILMSDGNVDSMVMYRRTMEEFVRAINGETPALATGAEGAAALAVALAALESAAHDNRIQPVRAAA